jgi:hypothetical protein
MQTYSKNDWNDPQGECYQAEYVIPCQLQGVHQFVFCPMLYQFLLCTLC